MTVPAPAAQSLAPGLRRLLAPNPSPMTLQGTNSYLLGGGPLGRGVAVIDPGPDLPQHLAAILAALAPGEEISHIFVTHSHLDHSPLARPLARITGAPILAFGASNAGRSALMESLSRNPAIGGGEGVDHDFAPDLTLDDGARISGDGWDLAAIHTPGHFSNHLSFRWQDRIFTGDQVMGWASSLISPPDGDMGAYMASLDRLAREEAAIFHPGHGDPIPDPAARLAELATHRRAREAQILTALADQAATIPALTRRIYHDTPAALLPAAERNVFAHLIDMTERKLISPEGALSPESRFFRA